MKRIEILDTTLRDGVQAEGITFSVEDKRALSVLFDELQFDYLEGGNSFANPKDKAFFNNANSLNLKNTKLVAFGTTRRKNSLTKDDLQLKALISSNVEVVTIVGKCWQMQLKNVLEVVEEENLSMVFESVRSVVKAGKKVLFDAEHFFDAYRDNPIYALDVLTAAKDAGASVLVLCDTNGATLPEDVFAVTQAVAAHFFDTTIGIHCHNDSGLAVANTIAAVRAGATHIQGTFIGYGERCGNANLSTVIPNLQLKYGYKILPEEVLKKFTSAAMTVAEISNFSLPKNLPYVGKSAFSHKAGMHSDGVIKYTPAFEHVSPYVVGNSRRFLLSEVAGRAAFTKKMSALFPDYSFSDDEIVSLLSGLKELENAGYQFEGADAGFYIYVKRRLSSFSPLFEVQSYSVTTTLKDDVRSATAKIKIKVGADISEAEASGNGPVNALDTALRLAASQFFPEISKMYLLDYKVRVINSEAATGAMVRVLITSTDGHDSWTTVGVSTDVIEASERALCDSVQYRLEIMR
jgi:2-isopropylmalate synthase/homocitrate synthase family protein